MAEVDEVIALMVANKEPKEKIIEFINNYKKQKAASKAETKTEVKEDDFVSSIPGLKEKLVKTQETKTPEVSVSSPKKTTATKVEEPVAETVAETTEQATYDEADFNLESEINQLQKEGLWNDNKKPSDSDPHVNPNDDRISTTLGKKYYKPDGSPMTNKEVREYNDAYGLRLI